MILLLVFISGCNGPIGGQTSSMIRMCPGIYELESALGYDITNDEEAFDILKEGMTFDDSEGVWVEDHFPESTTVEGALDGVFLKDQEIELVSGEKINAWVIGYGKHKALDLEGNIYLCEFN